ncbi:AAA family ATPase [Candidatus Pacearchaeota archaeon]|nr:AAA family ATPase [Candidatus Pacearchaeota archaeon]
MIKGCNMDKLDKIFSSFISNNLFKNKSVLQSNYSPEQITHREAQIESVASILAPALRGERVSNLFIYGNTGSGKTLSVRYVRDKILEKLQELGGDYLQFIYVNCKLKKVADTEYRIVAEMIHELKGSIPATGLPTDQVYLKFIEMIDVKKQVIIIILDEIDEAVKKISDRFIYTLTRLNSELKNAQISIIGISNSLTFMDHLDPRVRSSLSEEELVFPSYNALQLQDILRVRAEQAFKEGVLEEGVIEKCAAYAAREHGDARRALDLLRVAGEISEREEGTKIKVEHIDSANQKIEKDKMLDIVEKVPKQFQLVLAAALSLHKNKIEEIFTGDVYNTYQDLCQKTRNEVLTQRRVSDILAEFDMLGLINTRVISKGRQGRTREIKLMLPGPIQDKAEEILQKSLYL